LTVVLWFLEMTDPEGLGKQRLRPWLEGLLNKGSIEGLYWLDNTRTKFRVPWYNYGRQNWSAAKGQIFKV
jgi:Interferon regulatory factor transcription factor